MITWIALLPFLIAAIYVFYYLPEKAFFNIYLPILLLLPQVYTADLPILHSLNFAQNALLPIVFAFFFYKTISNRYSSSILCFFDVLVFTYVGLCAYSEYINTGPKFVFSLLIDKTMGIIFPYYLARHLIHPLGNSIKFARRFVFLIFIDILLSVYEMRFSVNPYIVVFSKLFPGQALDLPTIFRYGLVRIAGPFVHTILFGITIGIAFLINYWLWKNKFWQRSFQLLKLPITKAFIIGFVLLIGLILTFSRGPIFCTIAGLIIAGIGNAKNRKTSFVLRFGLLAIVFLISYEYLEHYSEINRYFAESDFQSTAAYRAELLVKYQSYVSQRPYWGWGYTTLPISEGLISIDNQYLWLSLKHGIIPLIAFASIIVLMILRLTFRGVTSSNVYKKDVSLTFALLGIYTMIAATFFTVYMGMQVEPIFFIITGWIEGFLQTKQKASEAQLVLKESK